LNNDQLQAGTLNLHGGGGIRHTFFSTDWWIDITVASWCLTLSGIMSGLTIGLASIDKLNLEIAAKRSTKVAKSAKTIFAVIN